jgi:acetyl esterase
MPLDPKVRTIVRIANRLDGEADRSVPMAVRRAQSARLAHFGRSLLVPKGPEPAATTEHLVPVAGGSIRVQIVHPHGAGPHPLHVFLHGGGWCVGTLEEREPRCREISAGASCVVASVDYRLAPENQYPTPPEDCYSALCWLVDHASEIGIDPSRVSIGGESAGGNLAAAVCLMSRDRNGPPLVFQWLDVPALDATLSTEGHRNVPDGNLLDEASIEEYLDLYLPDRPTQVTEPYCSPLLADDLTGLPPAHIVTMEFDKLRGDGEAYAKRLADAGIATTHVRLAGHVHASFALTRRIPSAAANERESIAALAAAYRR